MTILMRESEHETMLVQKKYVDTRERDDSTNKQGKHNNNSHLTLSTYLSYTSTWLGFNQDMMMVMDAQEELAF